MLHRLTTILRGTLACLAATAALLTMSSAAHAQGCANATNDCFTTNLGAGGCNNASCC